MTRPELAPDLRRFIVSNIVSVPYLEAILLLRAEPQRVWTAQEMARRLYIADAPAAELLETAVKDGIAVLQAQEPVAVCYKPATPELADVLSRLAAHYASDVVTVATLIHGRTDNMRAQQFADAFRWRKDS